MADTQRQRLRLTRGTRLGKYRLEKKLGTGGFCEVWRARDRVEGIEVALKIPRVARDGRRDNQTILREVHLVCRLRHPHVLPFKNADIINGQAVLATALSPDTLDEHKPPMAPRKIIPIIAQVLEGLAYAHTHRVVHCDVSPGNIFLLSGQQAAIGDFGIGLRVQGRAKTIDDYGTPGYVAPEQAFGRPTYQSDCFSVALILYEYLTGYLPRWPFNWPFPGHARLLKQTNHALARFLKRALAVEPKERYSSARHMLAALVHASGELLAEPPKTALPPRNQPHWLTLRRRSFTRRYQRIFANLQPCGDCGEPIDETMQCCPWCGSRRNRFDRVTRFDLICPDCHKGVLPEWRFCPWCYGAGFAAPAEGRTRGVRYHDDCKSCGGGLLRFMRYCPWCRRKVRQAWQCPPLPQICSTCRGGVDSSYWTFCPWCKANLTA